MKTQIKKSNYIPYVFDPNNIPKNGLIITLPTNSRGAPAIRAMAKRVGVHNTLLPHNGHYISWLPPEHMTKETISLLNGAKAIRNERIPEYWCEMRWEDIHAGDSSFPFQVCVGKLKFLHGEPKISSTSSVKDEVPSYITNSDTSSFDFINQVFSDVDDVAKAKINAFAGNDVVRVSKHGEHYIDGDDMNESLWNMLVQEKYLSGFIGYLNPKRLKEAKVKLCWQHGPRAAYKRVQAVFGKEFFAPIS
jgi:hypothetical protein